MGASTANLASKINPKVTTVKGKGPRKGSKAPTIIEVATSNPSLSSSEIGKIVGCSHVNVVNTLHRYGIDIQATHEVVHRLENILPLPTDKEVGYMPKKKKGKKRA